MPIEVGALASDFTLRDQNNEEVTLSSFRGRKAVLLVFYPLAFTGICTGELCAVRDDLSTFQNEDVQVITLSVDSPYSHKIFAEREGYQFPLLSDFWPHGEVSRAFDNFDEKHGCPSRSTFIIDKQGVVRWVVRNAMPEARDLEEYVRALKEIAA
jgi:peroxiredoxin